MPKYEIRPYEDGDEDLILETFNLVFRENDANFQPRTFEEWEWAHTKNPGGVRLWLAIWAGQVVAQYGSQPSRTWIDGEERVFAQIIDSMVHPEHRRGLKRPGLFVQVAHEMLSATCGPDRDLVTYGWPNPQAWRIGKAFLGYEMVRMQCFLSRRIDEGPRELPDEVEELHSFDHQARWLYDRCSGPWGASIIRDETFLNWRFFEHPRFEYQALGVRDDEGILRGYAVVRTAQWHLPERSLIVMDWLVPPDEVSVGLSLREGLMALGRQLDAAVTLATFPEWSPWFARFQEWGWLVYPSDYLMSGRNNVAKHDMYWLRDNWWYQLAEMDII